MDRYPSLLSIFSLGNVFSKIHKERWKRFIAALLLSAMPYMSLAADFGIFPLRGNENQAALISRGTSLGQLNEKLNKILINAIASSYSPRELQIEQHQWEKYLRSYCTSDQCLISAYEQRITTLEFSCASPNQQFQEDVCNENTIDGLRLLLNRELKRWIPYLTKRSYYPDSAVTALEWWNKETDGLFENATKNCISFQCKRAGVSQMLERWHFPQSEYEGLLKWIEANGENSTLADSNAWTLKKDQATAVWSIIRGRIYLLGPIPAWLEPERNSKNLTAAAPFLNRPLGYWAAENLKKMIKPVTPLANEYVVIGGIDPDLRQSVRFVTGEGGADCKPNWRGSSIYVAANTSDASIGRRNGRDFNIIEIKDLPIDQPIPYCTSGNPVPRGFFSYITKNSFRSPIVVDDILDVFVRRDGTFWLQLADENWYRFRRDMTTESVDFEGKYHVLPYAELERLVNMSTDITMLERALNLKFKKTEEKSH